MRYCRRVQDARYPRSVYRHGTEPDARFTLANERTFLAWIRTALTLVAAGVGVEALGQTLQPYLRVASAIALIVTGSACAVMAWVGWVRVERALRLGQPLPNSMMRLPLVIGLTGCSVLLILSIVLA